MAAIVVFFDMVFPLIAEFAGIVISARRRDEHRASGVAAPSLSRDLDQGARLPFEYFCKLQFS
jgi:hypothetical protein